MNKLHIVNTIIVVTQVLDWLYAYYDNVLRSHGICMMSTSLRKEVGGHDEIHGEIIKLKAMIGWQNSLNIF